MISNRFVSGTGTEPAPFVIRIGFEPVIRLFERQFDSLTSTTMSAGFITLRSSGFQV
jgi:hypothetical protein